MVYNDSPDPELNGHWFEKEVRLIFWVFAVSTLIGLGIIYLVVP